MSKARHLGNLLDTDGDVISSSLDNVDTSSFIEKINWQHNAGTVGTFNELKEVIVKVLSTLIQILFVPPP